MPSHVWTPGMLNVLLSHIDSHKGENGLYMTKISQAISDARCLILKKYPSHSVTDKQIWNKLIALWKQERKKEYKDGQDLFRFGRTALHPRYSQANLEDREKKGLSGLGSKKWTMQSAVPPNEKILKAPIAPSNVRTDPTPQSGGFVQSFDFDSGTQNETHIRQEPEREQELDAAGKNRLLMGRTDCNQRCEKITRFLRNDKNQYLPSQERLDFLKGQTMRWIRDVALWFLETAGIEDGKVMDLYGCQSSRPFFSICKRLYNVNTREELLEKSGLIQLRSPLNKRDFVRALTAAAITDWVFEGKHNPLPGEFSQPSKAAMKYESILAELDLELHEQVLRKRNHEYVKNEASFDAYLPNLTLRFAHAIMPFLICNTATSSPDSCDQAADGAKAPQWPDTLSKAFRNALELHAQVLLLGQDYKFQLPRSGDEFDRNSMVTESDLPKRTRKGGKVHVVLFPALVQTTQTQDRNNVGEGGADEQTIYLFKATVILQ